MRRGNVSRWVLAFAVVAALAFAAACSRSPYILVLGPGTATQTLWDNGVAGVWQGYPVSVTLTSGTTAAVAACDDTLNGDTLGLRIGTQAGGGFQLGLASAVTRSAAAFYPSGHIQFDLLLNQACVDSVGVAYGSLSEFGTGANAYLYLTGSYSTTAFTHVSLPLSSFSADDAAQVSLPFVLFGNACAAGPAVTVCDVRVTVD